MVMSKNRRHELRLVTLRTEAGPQKDAPGKIVHDSRGNARWDWAIDTGVLARKTASELLQSLDEPGRLALEAEGNGTPEWSGDPYNRSRN
jgi:hypothetical protein